MGARRADLPGAKNAGSAYVCSREGGSFGFVRKLVATDPEENAQFGQAVAIAGDTIAVGANRADVGTNTDQGEVYLCRRAGGAWDEFATITASDGAAGDEFGYSLAAFGGRLLTGAHFAESAGVAYVVRTRL